MAGGGPPFSLGVETHQGLAALTRAIRAEEDGKQLRKELAANMREALKPGAEQAKRTNRASGWRHPVYGNRENWVHQRGKLEWFDRAFRGREGMYKQAVEQAMEDMARRIASRAR
jgi:hypothetical protein